jgi:hypothetical protein
MRNLITKAKAAHLEMRVRRFLLLGCGFSLLGLYYSLRKPRLKSDDLLNRYKRVLPDQFLHQIAYKLHSLNVAVRGSFIRDPQNQARVKQVFTCFTHSTSPSTKYCSGREYGAGMPSKRIKSPNASSISARETSLWRIGVAASMPSHGQSLGCFKRGLIVPSPWMDTRLPAVCNSSTRRRQEGTRCSRQIGWGSVDASMLSPRLRISTGHRANWLPAQLDRVA